MKEATHRTLRPPDTAVKLDYVARAGLLVQAIDILRDESELGEKFLPASDLVMRLVRKIGRASCRERV